MYARRMPALRWWLGATLALASSGAWALGLGEIRVLSQPGQPLVAEIPVISNDPSELEQLRAGLASPAVFERVGLERPSGLVSELDFAVAVGTDGKPAIRVTSRSPVDVAALNFLVEVDWGQGRLVREYSALVDAPGSLAAQGQPVIEAPAPAPADVIAREPAPLPPAVAQPAVPPPLPAGAAAAPAQVAAAPAAPAALDGAGQVQVQRGQTLSGIARQVDPDGSLDQTMVALLRANPEAFINGNLNRLRQGAVLRVPSASETASIAETEAAALVRRHVAEWRQAGRPVPQPLAAPEAAPESRPAAAAPAVADARLEIAPAVAGTSKAGTNSGIQAGGEGDMLANQELRQTREDLAARESELQELRERVADLEKLQKQQAQLISMKDTDLAAAQQRLAQKQDAGGGGSAWLWAGLAMLVVGLLGGYFLRRRTPQAAVPRGHHDSAAMATAVPERHDPAPAAAPADAVSEAASDADAAPQRQADVFDVAPAAIYTPSVAPETSPLDQPAPRVVAPQWSAAPTARPTWHSRATTPPAATAAAPDRERLELAVACLDLGDVDTARALLNEVAAGEDPGTREEAVQLLRRLG